MIRGTLEAFKRTCEARGVRFEDAEACIVSRDGDMVLVDEFHQAYPWERGAAGEAMRAAVVKKLIAKAKPPAGPGHELKKLLSKLGIQASSTCACNQRANTMDERGVQWCEENIETICDWLAEEAGKRSLPFVRSAGKLLIRMAIRNAKKGISQ